MKRLFSDDFKFSTWRRLWIALAESEKELGLDISDAQIEQMKAHVDDIDYESATSSSLPREPRLPLSASSSLFAIGP